MREYCLEQIQSLALVQTCSVMQMQIGLHTSLTFKELTEAFRPILSDVQLPFVDESIIKIIVGLLLCALDIPSDSYHLGRTRLF